MGLARLMRAMFGNGISQALVWLTIYLAGLGVAVTYGFWVDHRQDVERCEKANEARTKAVLIVTEALVEAAEDPDPERVERFLADIERRLDANTVTC